MIQIITADAAARQLAAMRSRSAQKNADIEQAVCAVMQDVKENGFGAVEKYSLQFDHTAPYEIEAEVLEQAYASCPGELIDALEHAADRKSVV